MTEKEHELKLFLSVDIVGSTKAKHDVQFFHKWRFIFQSFYDDFYARAFESAWASVYQATVTKKPSVEHQNLPKPSFWKAAGDEMLFQVTLASTIHLQICIEAFKNAVDDYAAIIHKKDITRNGMESTGILGLKATAWIAEFPVYNAILRIGEQDDYIGPAIDRGFRLTTYSTQEKFVVSVELAYLLVRNPKNQFFYDGLYSLKGVPSEYPVFWLSMGSTTPPLRIVSNNSDVENWCDSYIEKSLPQYRPFLKDDGEFSRKYSEYEKDKVILHQAEQEYNDSLSQELTIEDPNSVNVDSEENLLSKLNFED
jgi:hypothetical protein